MYCEAAIYSFEAIIGIPLFIIILSTLTDKQQRWWSLFVTILCSFISPALFLSFVIRGEEFCPTGDTFLLKPKSVIRKWQEAFSNDRFGFIRFLPFPPCPSTPPQFCYIVTCYNKVVPHVAQPSFALTARVALSPRLFQPFQPFHISSMHLTEEPLEHNYVVCRIYLSLCSERLWSLDNMLYCHGLMQLCR